MHPLAATLKQHNIKLTTVRTVVFDAMQGQEPLTVNELIKQCGTIDRASVYRTITLFQKLGIIQRLQTGWKYKLELSDAFHEHHHHMTCLTCGQTRALPEDKELENVISQLADKHNFTIAHHQLELQGTCHNCRA